MNEKACALSIKYNDMKLIESIAECIELKFLTEESKPTTVKQAYGCAVHILEAIINALKEKVNDPEILACFSLKLGLDADIDREKSIDALCDKENVPHELRELLKKLLK